MNNNCCNKKIPKSTSKSLILRPNGKVYINGIASSYELIYFDELKPYISAVEYNHTMERIVDGMVVMWPCDFCLNYAYFCSVFTLGLSFLCPLICINEAVGYMIEDINNANRDVFNKHNLNLSLQRRCCTSWLQIDIIDQKNVDNKLEMISDGEDNDNKLIEVKENIN